LAEDLTQAPPESVEGIDTFGPLARGLALVEQSAQTREKIDTLLSKIPTPMP
jgi:hypothetical protein